MIYTYYSLYIDPFFAVLGVMYYYHCLITIILYIIVLGILNSEPKLNDLMNKVATAIPAKWEDVGYALGIEKGSMDRIKCETIRLSSTITSYREVFNYWLSHKTHCTWTVVLNALATEQVGAQQLARRIRHELLQQIPNQ